MIQLGNYSVPVQLHVRPANPNFKLFTVSMAHVRVQNEPSDYLHLSRKQQKKRGEWE